MSVEERATAADRVLAARERYVARGVSTPTLVVARAEGARVWEDRKSTRLNSSHSQISYAAFCWKKNERWHRTRLERAFGQGRWFSSFIPRDCRVRRHRDAPHPGSAPGVPQSCSRWYLLLTLASI